ncbi:MAG: hypothetical protein H0X38_14055 [Planctomycetes bacterium]|nr:hypothetical protein [Planctomycetota bacterium]
MRTVALLLLLVATACGSAAFAAEGTAEKPQAAHNSVCPVSGDTVDADTKPVVVKLKDGSFIAIGLCCTDCKKELNADPDKFAAAALANKKAAK